VPGRHRTITSGAGRRRLIPSWPRRRFRARRSARFALNPTDGGTDELPGVFGG
jgi:hypothetical protein